jgi:uncharacterized SAM-binding protein YcdF (DUF218 family)
MEWVLRLLIDPLFIWLALLTLIVVLFWRAKLRWAKVSLALFLALSFLASSLILAFHAAQPLESFALENFKYADYRERPNLPCERYEGVIALGGVIPNSDFSRLRGIQVGSSAERVIEPVRLQRFCPNFKLVFTSFGKDLNGEVGESELARELWRVENQSTNTYENARESAKLLGVEGRWLLVTSASHVKRAVESFRGFGMQVDPIPVDYLFSQSPSLLEFSIFDGLSIWRTISHEYFGILYYRLTKWNSID